MELYDKECFRRPTQTDVEKLYDFHEAEQGFIGMVGSIDYTIIRNGRGLNAQLHYVVSFVGVISSQIHSFY